MTVGTPAGWPAATAARLSFPPCWHEASAAGSPERGRREKGGMREGGIGGRGRSCIVGKFGNVKIRRFDQFFVLVHFNFGKIAAATNDVTEMKKSWLKFGSWPLIVKSPN